MALNGMIFVGPWGGPGGDNWSFKASNGITQILIREKVNIQSISFKDASGNISGTFGGGDDNVTNDPEKKIEIHWPSEYLKSISGTFGNYWGLSVIKSLSFITNLTTYGPFGTTSGDDKPFSIPIADSVIAGFYGRAGYYLDALGILVQPVDLHETISFGPWGGPGGGDFSFKVGSWIKEIIVHDGPCINSIAFKDAEGHYYGKFGGNDPKDIGVERIVEVDGQLEHLTCISGTYGEYKGLEVIKSLSFITNLTTHGPFGSDSGTSFSIPIQGSLVIGFHGRSGYYLDAIGIFVKPNTTK